MTKILLILLLLPNLAFADCDFSTGITPTDHNTFEYTEECHLAVGQMQEDLVVSRAKNLNLALALKKKDLALGIADERAEKWMQTSFQLQESLDRVQKYQKQNGWACYGAGFMTVVLAGIVSRQLNH
jgi:hypothetical protein